MSSEFSYKDYVTDEDFLAGYNAYQRKYATQIRESDKIILGMVGDLLRERGSDAAPAELLDIGCSTGNLLLHLKRSFPGLRLTGGDLAEASLAECHANSALTGIEFRTLDLLDLPANAFDIVTVNAVLYMMADAEFERALASLSRALRQGGALIAFDFCHPFEQDIRIIERSRTHAEGLALHFRPEGKVRRWLDDTGFRDPVFRPFTLPIDLPRPADDGELISYTVTAADGRRLPFRGTLFQPWCHILARKR
jgi:SAM-dependent methyltransferase